MYHSTKNKLWQNYLLGESLPPECLDELMWCRPASAHSFSNILLLRCCLCRSANSSKPALRPFTIRRSVTWWSWRGRGRGEGARERGGGEEIEYNWFQHLLPLMTTPAPPCFPTTWSMHYSLTLQLTKEWVQHLPSLCIHTPQCLSGSYSVINTIQWIT